MDIYCVTLDSSLVTFKDNEDAIIVDVWYSNLFNPFSDLIAP